MKNWIFLLTAMGFFIYSHTASAFNLCGDPPNSQIQTEILDLETEEFSLPPFQSSSLSYDERVLNCNRSRDSQGAQIAALYQTSQSTLLKNEKNLPEKIVKGTLRYLGLASLPYSYLIKKENGTWVITTPLHFDFLNSSDGAIDLPFDLAQELQIATQCDSQTKLCRIQEALTVNGLPLRTHLMKYWQKTIETAWTKPGFKVLAPILNLGEIPSPLAGELLTEKVYWPIFFNRDPSIRPMYYPNPLQARPLYSGIEAHSIAHEAGHLMGLDDEYPEENLRKLGMQGDECQNLGGDTYLMCQSSSQSPSTKGIYSWIITRRYLVGI